MNLVELEKFCVDNNWNIDVFLYFIKNKKNTNRQRQKGDKFLYNRTKP